MAVRGLQLEDEIEYLMQGLIDNGLIINFTRHPHNSPEDESGRDFTVVKQVNNVTVSVSFGVTISLKCWNRAKFRHRETPQFCFPPNCKRETMIFRIMNLFG